MKYIAVGLLAIALSACSTDQAQDEEQAQIDPTPAQAEVEVKEEFNPIPFDPEAGVAHLNRLGDIVNFIQDTLGEQTKSQFETTEAYEARIAQAKNELAPLDFEQIYVVVNPKQRLQYDADEQVYSTQLEEYCIDGRPPYWADYISCRMDDWSVQTKLDGTALLGQNIEVTNSEGPVFYGLLPQSDSTKLLTLNNVIPNVLPNSCPVPLDRAQGVYETLRIGYGLRFTKAQVIAGLPHASSATVSSPVQMYNETYGIPATITHLVCFDGQTNKVLYQREL